MAIDLASSEGCLYAPFGFRCRATKAADCIIQIHMRVRNLPQL